MRQVDEVRASDIGWLRGRADARGDSALVEVCGAAINGDSDAMREAARRHAAEVDEMNAIEKYGF
jgi:hypothetical protein